MKTKWYDAEFVVPAKKCVVYAMDRDGFPFTTSWDEKDGWASVPKYWSFSPSLDDVEFEVEHG